MRDRPSATAYRVAMSRAAHQLLDRPRLLEDEIALGLYRDRSDGLRVGGFGRLVSACF